MFAFFCFECHTQLTYSTEHNGSFQLVKNNSPFMEAEVELRYLKIPIPCTNLLVTNVLMCSLSLPWGWYDLTPKHVGSLIKFAILYCNVVYELVTIHVIWITVFIRSIRWTLSVPDESNPHPYNFFFRIYINTCIILPSMPVSPKWSLPFRSAL
jgi:hypothetical protein